MNMCLHNAFLIQVKTTFHFFWLKKSGMIISFIVFHGLSVELPSKFQ